MDEATNTQSFPNFSIVNTSEYIEGNTSSYEVSHIVSQDLDNGEPLLEVELHNNPCEQIKHEQDEKM